MAVFRVERTQNYTVMSNYHLRDRRLSLKAKGLLSLMLSLPEDWDYTLSGLARISLEGKDAIRAAVVELEQAGYVQRRQTTDKAGKFSSNEYIIREWPNPEKMSLIHISEPTRILSSSYADFCLKKKKKKKNFHHHNQNNNRHNSNCHCADLY